MVVSHEVFWWDCVTGPRATVDGTVDALVTKGFALLDLPPVTPWEDVMRASIRRLLHESAEVGELEQIDFELEAEEGRDSYLDGRVLGVSRDGAGDCYRPSWGSLADYACQTGLLAKRVLWVRTKTDRQAKDWLSFCDQCISSSASLHGIIIVERHGSRKLNHTHVAIPSVCYLENTDENSVRILCGALMDEARHRSMSRRRKAYGTALLVHLCGGRVDVASILHDRLDFLHGDPKQSMMAVLKDLSVRPHGVSEDPDLGCITEKEVERRLWRAQVEVVFPALEEERMRFIETYRTELERNIRAGIRNPYGECIESVYDIELGTMCWMVSGNAHHQFAIDADIDTVHRLGKYRDTRNLLAHNRICDSELLSWTLDRGMVF